MWVVSAASVDDSNAATVAIDAAGFCRLRTQDAPDTPTKAHGVPMLKTLR